MKIIMTLTITVCIVFSTFAQEKTLDSYISESQALQKQGKLKEAVALMQEAVNTHMDSPVSHLHLGLAWGAVGQNSGNTGDFMGAMNAVNQGFAAFEKAIELDPDYYEAHFYYGVYGVSVPSLFGKLDSGVAHLEKALELVEKKKGSSKEEIATVHRYLGQGYRMQEKFKEAKKSWKRVLALQPEGPLADAAEVGLAGLKQAEATARIEPAPEKAVGSEIIRLEKKVEASPEDFDLIMELAQAYFDDEHWTKSADAFERATRLKPDDAMVYLRLAMAIGMDAQLGYDERIYRDTDLRTNQAFNATRYLERAFELDPDNPEIKMFYAVACVQMPFFVGRIDKGLELLEEMAHDENLSEDIRAEALYQLGFGYRKKGNAVWMKLAKDFPQAEVLDSVYAEYGLREYGKSSIDIEGERVTVTFHLGFLDELPPQTAVWVEDAGGEFVKTLYVSGFSGYAKDVQVNLPNWAKKSQFETDGTTGASVDWGKHTYAWDLKDQKGKRIEDGNYTVHVEVAWWPSMKYGRATTEIQVGGETRSVTGGKAPYVPLLYVEYIK